MFNAEQLQEKWKPLLEHDGIDNIKDNHRKAVTAVLLENQERFLTEEKSFLSEAPTVNTNTGSSAGIRGVPTVIVYKKGVEVSRKVGGVPESHMKQFLDENI